MSTDGPEGHVLIEVDDVASHGAKVHDDKMQKLRRTLKFGKWKSIYQSEGDYAGRTIVQLTDYSFKLHQAKFIKERFLELVEIAKGRRSDEKGRNQSRREVTASCGAWQLQLGATRNTARCFSSYLSGHEPYQ